MAFVLILAVAVFVNLLFFFYAKSQIRSGISREELEEDVLIFMFPIDVVILGLLAYVII